MYLTILVEAVRVTDCGDINSADLGTSSKESYWDTIYFKIYEPRMIEVGKGSTMQLNAMWVSQS